MSNRAMRRGLPWLTASVLMSVVLMAGCTGNSGPAKYPVSGTVTYQGKPVENGAIILFPTNSGGGMQDGIKIVDGKFEGEATAGPKRVFIEAKREGPIVQGEFGGEFVSEDWYIPPKYNERSTMTLEILPEENRGLVYDLE
ncbi:hypothetical protein AB1K70_09505 [Bremerella sp. JC770]|uniref:hypothetical protein n=1 Tax=Bremerella sp. JC770 TaxID=3232137 RepID=UPI003457BCDE